MGSSMRKVGVLEVCSHQGGGGSKDLFTPQWEWSLDLGLSDSGAPP